MKPNYIWPKKELGSDVWPNPKKAKLTMEEQLEEDVHLIAGDAECWNQFLKKFFSIFNWGAHVGGNEPLLFILRRYWDDYYAKDKE